MIYYAPKPFKQDDGIYRATDTDGNVAFGDTEEEAMKQLEEKQITSNADELKHIADKENTT